MWKGSVAGKRFNEKGGKGKINNRREIVSKSCFLLKRHGIISVDIIPAPVRRPTKEDIILGEPCARPGGEGHNCASHGGMT